jgi:S1-C subfamily serine protease
MLKELLNTKTIFIVFLLLLLSSCAVNSGIVQMGNSTYIVTRQAATGFSGLGSLKAEAMKEANAFCQKSGKSLVIIKTTDSEPPYVLGNFPRTEICFKCISIENTSNTVPVSSGTGFAISKTGIVVTNSHVIAKGTKIFIRGINGDFSRRYLAKVLVEDKNNDLAIIKLIDSIFISDSEIPFIISSTTSDVGTSVFTLGYPLKSIMGEEIKLTNGIISSKSGFQGDVTCYQISVPLQPGNSGGPLIDHAGNLIGITNSKLVVGENVSYAIKAKYLVNLLEVIPSYQLTDLNSLNGKPLVEQAKMVSKFVYIIEVEHSMDDQH